MTTILLLTSMFTHAAAPAVSVENLRCEYLHNPLGIDVAAPRLSWELHSTGRGVAQTAYEVLVATEPILLTASDADLWSSGKVESDKSAHVEYAGAPLTSGTTCYWRVRVWDQAGEASAWSEVGTWRMGLLEEADWQGVWIGAPEASPKRAPEADALTFEGAHWIWYPEGKPVRALPAGIRYFRRTFDVPEPKTVERMRIAITADDKLVVYANGDKVGEGCRKEHGRCFDATHLVRPGRNVVAVEVENGGRGSAGLLAKVELQFADGTRETLTTDDAWMAAQEGGETWNELEGPGAEWESAEVLGPVGMDPWGVPEHYPAEPTQTAPSPVFRREFELNGPVARATAHISGLGFYELYCNGARVGDHVLDPLFTRYDKRVHYVTYDLTEQLRAGANALGVMLGNGWYNMHARAEWDFDRAPWRATPRMRFHLRIEYEDGTRAVVGSDTAWKATRGPVLFDCIRNGEVYDARKAMPGWDAPGFDDGGWSAAEVKEPPKGELCAQMAPASKVMKTLDPVRMWEPAPGIYVFDLGQNMAGWVRLRASGEAGAEVTLKYAERLTEAGFVDQANNIYVHSGPFQTDRLILAGAPVVWEPRFVYHGFQYVQIEGLSAPPALEDVTGCVVHNAFEETGRFNCGNDLYNRIQECAKWAYLGNYANGYPTDCPHREKNGWTGDAHLAANQALYNFAPTAVYTKWLNDFKDEMRENGELPGIIPSSGWGYGIGPSWDCAYVLLPWYLHLYRGDTRVLEEHYGHLQRYLDYLGSRAKDHIVDYGLGDWVPAKTQTPNEITSTAYYYVDTVLLGRMAKALGKADDAARYEEQAEAIRTAFNERFFRESTGAYAPPTQTAQACALYQGLAPEEARASVTEALAAALAEYGNHFDGGILGAKYLLHALSDNGRHDLAYTVTNQTDFPSWGRWIEEGATTLWENWDGTLSRNHIMFGDISAWFYKTLAGIRPDPEKPGFKHIIIKPQPPAGLEWASGECASPYGVIESGWRRTPQTLTLTLQIPGNTTATVYVPTDAAEGVYEGNTPATETDGVRYAGEEDGYAVFSVGSGRYRFVSPLNENRVL